MVQLSGDDQEYKINGSELSDLHNLVLIELFFSNYTCHPAHLPLYVCKPDPDLFKLILHITQRHVLLFAQAFGFF